jgi:hypothetical protein
MFVIVSLLMTLHLHFVVLAMVHGNNQLHLLSFASAKESSKECALFQLKRWQTDLSI